MKSVKLDCSLTLLNIGEFQEPISAPSNRGCPCAQVPEESGFITMLPPHTLILHLHLFEQYKEVGAFLN